MTVTEFSTALAVLGWLIFALWTVLLVPSTVALLHRRLLPRTRDLPVLEQWPLVSVIVPARDEAAWIESALRSLLASDYPNLEVIAIDDRSRDETGLLMDRLAAADERLRVVHVIELPDGWLGKNHALDCGARAARGEFLLFTDGDVIFTPDAIRLAMLYAVGRKIDHLCLMPAMLGGGYWENALVSYFGLIFTLGTQPWLVPTSFPLAYVGIGAFNLLRREAYVAVGGHEPIRLDVLDDVKLGKLMKRCGYRQDVLDSDGRVAVKWQESAWGVIRGLEKNAFASQNYSLTMLTFSTFAFCLLMVVPYAAVAALRDERALGYGAALVLVHTVYGLFGRTFGGGWRVLPALPIAALGMLFAFWRSAVITLRQGGVRWRDTFYPLETLRRNLYR